MKHSILLLALLVVFTACTGNASTPVENGTGDAIVAMQFLLPLSEAEVFARFNFTLTNAPRFVAVAHWDPSVPLKIPSFTDTEIASHGLITLPIDDTALADIATNFPVGQTNTLLVVAAEMPLTPIAETYHFVHLEVESTLAITVPDPTILLEYAFVFDQDGELTNNYAADPATNYYNDSDQWYVMSYSNAQGWRLRVFTATTSGNVDTLTEVASAARVIMTGNALILVVPASEFTVSDPDYRVTSFAHDGDFGIPAPHSWTGNAEPRLIEGLQDYPAQN